MRNYITNRVWYSNLMAMSEPLIPPKQLRKRSSTAAIREDEKPRKRMEISKPEMSESDNGGVTLESVSSKFNMLKEDRAKSQGERVKKTVKQRPRVHCCSCERRTGVSSKGECFTCEHYRCAQCLELERNNRDT